MKIKLVTLFVGLSLSICAQQKIVGTVTSSLNEPLIGVDIYIEELQIGASTDDKGYYELMNLPNASITISISYIGFESQSKTLVPNQDVTTLNIILKESIFEMDEIIVSTPFHKLQSENVMKVERISLQSLDEKGVLTLMEGITNIPGVSQVSTGVGIEKPVIRGLRGNRVLVYNQGIRQENQQFGDEHGLGINDFSIESVEVIKGPASLLYGSDALGGVLYFNPLRFAELNSSDIEFGSKYSSNTLGNNTYFKVKKSFVNWKFLANAGITEHSDYKTGDNSRVFNTRFREKSINLAGSYSNQVMSNTLRLQHTESDIGIPEDSAIQERLKTPKIPFQDLQHQLISLENVIFLENSKISSTFGYTQNKRKEFEEEHDEHEEEEDHEEDEDHDEHDEMHAALDLKLNTFSSDIKWGFNKKNGFQTVVGLQYIQQKNRNYGEEILIPDAEKSDIGTYLTTIYDKGKTSFQGGIRFDRRSISTADHEIHEEEGHEEDGHEEHENVDFEAIDKTYESVSLSLGMKTKLWNSIVTRINLASGFKAPTLAELTSNGVHHGTNRFEIGNSDLNSEKNFQWDLSLEYRSDHFEIFGNGFYNHINDYIFITPTGETEEEHFIFKYVQDDAKLYGGEFGLHLHPHPLDKLHFKSFFELVIGKQKNDEFLPLIPANKWTNEFSVEFNIKRLFQSNYATISLESHFAQNKVSQFETKNSGYNLVNIQAGGKLKLNSTDLILNISVNNLFNKSYIDHLSRLKNIGIDNIGRNFMVSLKFNI